MLKLQVKSKTLKYLNTYKFAWLSFKKKYRFNKNNSLPIPDSTWKEIVKETIRIEHFLYHIY